MRLEAKLKDFGFNRDVEISDEEWKNCMESEHSTSLALAPIERKNEPTYRDNRARESIELKDYRQLDRPECFVAELEHFNPERHPVLHLLVDFPSWLWKNRIKNWGPVGKDRE